MSAISDLTLAASSGDLDGVEQALARGARVNGHSTALDCTPLSAAISQGHEKVALYLIERGANSAEDGLIHAAARNGLAAVVGHMLGHGNDSFHEFTHQDRLPQHTEFP